MANYQVTTLDDVVNANDGKLSLREAIAQANGASGADTITFASNLSGGTIHLTGYFLQINDDVTINGDLDGNHTPDITIDAATIINENARAFYVHAGTSTLNGLTVTGGHLGVNYAGGGVAVDSGAKVTIRDSAITGNAAGSGGGVYVGAGSTATFDHATVSDNQATSTNGGGVYANGGKVTLTGTILSGNSAILGGGLYTGANGAATLTNVTVSGNGANYGGGLFVTNSAIKLADVTLSENSASGTGGGLYNGDGAAATLANVTVSGNSAEYGGGLYNRTDATLVDVTLSGNSALTTGGGIHNEGTAFLSNITVSGNSAANPGGGIYNYGGKVTLANSIVAGNAAPTSGADVSLDSGTVTFDGRNIFSQPGAGDADDIIQTNLTLIFAKVAANPYTGVTGGVLAGNGGPVQTILIKAGGVAEDAGVNGSLPFDTLDLDHDGKTNEPLPVDARGLARVYGGAVDIGAVELQPTAKAVGDAFVVAENGTVAGNVFSDNGSGADVGAGFSITAVNGVAGNVGNAITLASGAKVTVGASGALSYNPNHAFDSLPDYAGSGASNTTATDHFTYTITGGSTATVTVTVRGVDSNDVLLGTSGGDTLKGGAGFDTLVGGAGNDTLDGGANPSNQGDIMLGGAGDDTYYVDSTLDLVDEGFVFPDAGWGGTDTIISTANWFWDVESVGEIDRIAENAADPNHAGVTFVGGVFDNVLYGHKGTDILFGRGGNDVYVPGDGVDYISLSTLGLTDQNAYVGVDGHNTIIATPRTSGTVSYDIMFEFDPAKDKVDVSAYHKYASGADVLSHAVNDGAGSSYVALGDGLDYLYFVGLTKDHLLASDFIV